MHWSKQTSGGFLRDAPKLLILSCDGRKNHRPANHTWRDDFPSFLVVQNLQLASITMLYNPLKRLPPEGFPAASWPCRDAYCLYLSVLGWMVFTPHEFHGSETFQPPWLNPTIILCESQLHHQKFLGYLQATAVWEHKWFCTNKLWRFCKQCKATWNLLAEELHPLKHGDSLIVW